MAVWPCVDYSRLANDNAKALLWPGPPGIYDALKLEPCVFELLDENIHGHPMSTTVFRYSIRRRKPESPNARLKVDDRKLATGMKGFVDAPVHRRGVSEVMIDLRHENRVTACRRQIRVRLLTANDGRVRKTG